MHERKMIVLEKLRMENDAWEIERMYEKWGSGG